MIDIMAWITDKTANHEDSTLDDSKVKEILMNKSYVKEAKTTSFIAKKGEYEIPYSELYTIGNTQPMTTIPAVEYTVGQEIELGGEQFYVLEDQGTTVKLLAKYCLNRAGTEQVNATYSETGRAFSKTNYWSNTFTNSPYDLQNEAMITVANTDGDVSDGVKNAVIVAKDYGTSKGLSTGRLLTYEEANTIKNGSVEIMKRILFGTISANGPTSRVYLLLAWFC